MAENTQEIRFGATTKELTEAVDGVKRQLESLKEFGEGLGDQLKELFAIREIVEFVKSMGELGEQTERVSLQLGISTEAVGELSGLALLTGTNIDSLALSIERMYLNVQRAARDGFNPGAQALKVLGLSAKDLIGLNADKYLEKLTEAASKFAPSLNLTTALMAIGGRGIISVSSNEIPAEMSRMVEMAERGDFAGARALHKRILPLLMVNFIESNPIPVKSAMASMGLLEEIYRLPMVPPRPASKQKIESVLQQLGIGGGVPA